MPITHTPFDFELYQKLKSALSAEDWVSDVARTYEDEILKRPKRCAHFLTNDPVSLIRANEYLFSPSQLCLLLSIKEQELSGLPTDQALFLAPIEIEMEVDRTIFERYLSLKIGNLFFHSWPYTHTNLAHGLALSACEGWQSPLYFWWEEVFKGQGLLGPDVIRSVCEKLNNIDFDALSKRAEDDFFKVSTVWFKDLETWKNQLGGEFFEVNQLYLAELLIPPFIEEHNAGFFLNEVENISFLEYLERFVLNKPYFHHAYEQVLGRFWFKEDLSIWKYEISGTKLLKNLIATVLKVYTTALDAECYILRAPAPSEYRGIIDPDVVNTEVPDSYINNPIPLTLADIDLRAKDRMKEAEKNKFRIGNEMWPDCGIKW